MSIQRPGLNYPATTGDSTSNFLKKFVPPIIKAFWSANLGLKTTSVKHISSGKAAQFITSATVSGGYFAPGDDLNDTAQGLGFHEKTILIDKPLISTTAIYDLDKKMSHFNLEGPTQEEMGYFLSDNMDRAIFSEALKGAEVTTDYKGDAAPTLNATGTYANKRVLAIDDSTYNGETTEQRYERLTSWIFKIAAYFDNQKIPAQNRYIVMSPDAYYTLAQNKALISKDYNGAGSIAEGEILRLAGFKIMKTPNLGKSPVTGGVIAGGDAHIYNGVLDTVEGIAYIPQSVGTVMLGNSIKAEIERQVNLQRHLFVASYLVGHGYLRPETIVSFGVDNSIA